MNKGKGPDVKAIKEAMDNSEPVVIPELQDLLDTLSDDSSAILEKQILREGVRDPVVVWKERNALIDGHNRVRICRKNNLPFPPKIEKSFPSIDAAKEWIIENQLGRRNLTPDRFTYFLGKLYNAKKQGDSTVGGTREKQDAATAEKLGEQFGVSSKTVKRAGDTAIGIDRLEKIKGKIAKQEQLSGKGTYTAPELKEIGKASSDKVAAKITQKLDTLKSAPKKQAAPKKAPAPAPSVKLYDVVFVAPDFDNIGFNVSNQTKPPLMKNGALYMRVHDAHLATAMELLDKWNLDYECSFIFWSSDTENGTFSKVVHETMILATQGTVTGPQKGKEAVSVQKVNGQIDVHMIKQVEAYHPSAKKLDMRKGRTAGGWDGVT